MSGPNLPCDASPRRDRVGWLCLGLVALAGLFYAVVFHAMLTPHVDEAYRRTFITREFGAYPSSPVFEGRNGLAYRIGDRISLADESARLHLARFDWRDHESGAPALRRFSGRLFLHIDETVRVPLRLDLALECRMPAGHPTRLSVSVDGHPVGRVACGDAGPVRGLFDLPAGLIGRGEYDEIRIERPDTGWRERLATFFGLRARAVALSSFRIVRDGGDAAR